jgi:N-acetylneuraminic acid mutarotase
LSPSPANFPPLPRGVTSFGGAVVGDSLCIYGGNYGSAHEYAKEGQSGDLWRLDLARPEKWERLPGGPKLQGLAMVAHQGRLYRVGGFSAENNEGEEELLRSQADFARYSFDSQAWEPLPALPEPRSSHDAALVGDSLYVVGGWNLQGRGADAKWHDTALAVDLSSDALAWKPIAPPPFKRRALALAAWGDKLCAIGGMQEQGGPTTAVAVYDPQQDAWSEGPRLPGGGIEGFGASAFGCDGAVYITTLSGAIQRLPRGADRWQYLGQLEHPRFFHRLLPWGEERLVVVGGGNMTTGKVVELELLSVGKQ